jgi:ATP-dependent protease ClpP protease subunit
VNAASSSLYLYGVVGQDFDAASVAESLAQLGSARGPVTLYVNSPGGSFFDGKAIHAAIGRFAKGHKVTGVVDGVAASAASLLLMAAPRIEMSPGSSLMVHEVHAIASGRASDLEAQAALVRAENAQLAGIYAQRTGKSVEDVLAMLASGDTWFTAEAAVESRFADGIAGQKATPKNSAETTRRLRNVRITALRASAKGSPASRAK